MSEEGNDDSFVLDSSGCDSRISEISERLGAAAEHGHVSLDSSAADKEPRGSCVNVFSNVSSI